MNTPAQPTHRDAMNYVHQVQNTFQYTRPGMFHDLLDIMRAFVIHQSTTTTTIQWVNLLDIQYLDIIYGFKRFLPDKEARRLVDLRILYLALQDWLRRSRELEWSHPDWSRIWDAKRSVQGR